MYNINKRIVHDLIQSTTICRVAMSSFCQVLLQFSIVFARASCFLFLSAVVYYYLICTISDIIAKFLFILPEFSVNLLITPLPPLCWLIGCTQYLLRFRLRLCHQYNIRTSKYSAFSFFSLKLPWSNWRISVPANRAALSTKDFTPPYWLAVWRARPVCLARCSMQRPTRNTEPCRTLDAAC